MSQLHSPEFASTLLYSSANGKTFMAASPEAERDALQDAICVAVVPPGAVWIFSGANAHAVCNLGVGPLVPFEPSSNSKDDGDVAGSSVDCNVLCVNSYEAFCGYVGPDISLPGIVSILPRCPCVVRVVQNNWCLFHLRAGPYPFARNVFPASIQSTSGRSSAPTQSCNMKV